MSLGYAEKLSYREDLGGQLGAPEHFDEGAQLEAKITELVALVKQAHRIVAFTGAGISTSCGIPDFRGPNGIWTLQRSKKPLPQMKTSFVAAKPSYTHQALVSLLHAGKLSFIVSQNVDGLHLRSGVPRDRIAELHGNCFAERCEKCGAEYVRDFEIETVGFQYTKRRCTAAGCGGRLRDHILDWEDALPEEDLARSELHAKEADLAICLGTSLQITPACNLPLLTVKAGGKMVIVNLQKTPKDKKASLVIHARCDDVMWRVMHAVGLPASPYTRRDTLAVSLQQHLPRLRPSVSSSASLGRLGLGEASGGAGAGATGEAAAANGALEASVGARESMAAASTTAAAALANDSGAARMELSAKEGPVAGAGAAGSSSSDWAGAAAGPSCMDTKEETGNSSTAADGGGASGGGLVPLDASPAAATDAQRGSYPFTLAVHNQYGPKGPVPLLEQVEFEFEDAQLKSLVKGQAPFSVTRTAKAPGDYPVTITLRFSQAADEGRREVQLRHVVRLLPAPARAQRQPPQGSGGGGRGGRRQGGAAGATAPQQVQQAQQPLREEVQLVSFVTQEVQYDAPAPVASGLGPAQLTMQPTAAAGVMGAPVAAAGAGALPPLAAAQVAAAVAAAAAAQWPERFWGQGQPAVGEGDDAARAKRARQES